MQRWSTKLANAVSAWSYGQRVWDAGRGGYAGAQKLSAVPLTTDIFQHSRTTTAVMSRFGKAGERPPGDAVAKALRDVRKEIEAAVDSTAQQMALPGLPPDGRKLGLVKALKWMEDSAPCY